MITSLAYIGFSSRAADEWRSFGPEVLGAQLVPRDDAVALRVDSRAERIMVHPGDRDGLDYIGWDCGDVGCPIGGNAWRSSPQRNIDAPK